MCERVLRAGFLSRWQTRPGENNHLSSNVVQETDKIMWGSGAHWRGSRSALAPRAFNGINCGRPPR